MKSYLSFFFICIVLNGFAFNLDDMELLRSLFHQVDNEQDLDLILNHQSKMEGSLADSYFGSALVMKANYSSFPIKKFNYFSKGSQLIEQSILENQVVENTYLRLLIQLNAPRFLGYHKNIEEDLDFIIKHIDNSLLPALWKLKMLDQILVFENKKYDFEALKKKRETYYSLYYKTSMQE